MTRDRLKSSFEHVEAASTIYEQVNIRTSVEDGKIARSERHIARSSPLPVVAIPISTEGHVTVAIRVGVRSARKHANMLTLRWVANP